MKKYEYTLTTRVPRLVADSMSSICSSMNVNESDFVRKSLVKEIQRFENAENNSQIQLEYV